MAGGEAGTAWKEHGQPRHVTFWLQTVSSMTPSCQGVRMNPKEMCFKPFVTRHFLRLLSCLITLHLV